MGAETEEVAADGVGGRGLGEGQGRRTPCEGEADEVEIEAVEEDIEEAFPSSSEAAFAAYVVA